MNLKGLQREVSARPHAAGCKFSQYGHDKWLHIQTLNDWYAVQDRFLRRGENLAGEGDKAS